VTRGRTKSTSPREPATEELEWLRLTLTNIGGQYGEAIETLSWNAFVLVDDLLSPESSPRDWLQNGAANWVEGLNAGAELVRGVFSALSRPLGPSDPQSETRPGKITFFVDQFTEATDPVATEIPVDMFDKVKLTGGDIPTICINLTLSSDRKAVLVALYNLTLPLTLPAQDRAQKPQPNRKARLLPSGGHTATLSWGKGTSLTIAVNVAKTTAT
jgi:hypothetical protein